MDCPQTVRPLGVVTAGTQSSDPDNPKPIARGREQRAQVRALARLFPEVCLLSSVACLGGFFGDSTQILWFGRWIPPGRVKKEEHPPRICRSRGGGGLHGSQRRDAGAAGGARKIRRGVGPVGM